jgi:hypothetical protein
MLKSYDCEWMCDFKLLQILGIHGTPNITDSALVCQGYFLGALGAVCLRDFVRCTVENAIHTANT